MSVGGIFKLITNDGKQDRMLMATALLNRRLMDIEKMRSRNPDIKDPTPTLVDIERTHILFMNAHFKPFAAIGYEYNITRAIGATQTGSPVQFSIPQFGDFFNDMAVHVVLPAVQPRVNPNLTVTNWRYCKYPGVRLIEEVNFQVNGNPLDTYHTSSVLMYQKFYVQPNKEVGWNKCVGQENPVSAKLASQSNGWSQYDTLAKGPQTQRAGATPGGDQPALELFIPLLLWFNLDPRLSIPSVAIPYGQRYINIAFARASKLLYNESFSATTGQRVITPYDGEELIFEQCELYINNIFVNPEIHDIYIRRIGFSLIRVHREQYVPAQASDAVLLNQMKWPIETMYVGLRPDAQDEDPDTWNLYGVSVPTEITLAEKSQSLNQWTLDPTLTYSNPVLTAELTNVVNGAGFPVAIAVGGGPNVSVANLNTALTAAGLRTLDTSFFPVAATMTPAQLQAAVNNEAGKKVTVMDCHPSFEEAGIEAHGVPLYKVYPSLFYNAYLPFTYGSQNIRTPCDCGVLMINFNLYPGSYQPSGHVNVSRAREFYFNYKTTDVVDFNNVRGFIHVTGVAINFLLISDGSAILRYST